MINPHDFGVFLVKGGSILLGFCVGAYALILLGEYVAKKVRQWR